MPITTDIGPVLANPYVRNGRVPIIYNIGPVLAKQLVATMVACMSVQVPCANNNIVILVQYWPHMGYWHYYSGPKLA